MPAFPFIRQPGAMDCGPVCLQMVAEYYGKKYSLEFLRKKTQVGKEGVNLIGISEAAESIGFRTTAQRVSFERLRKNAPLPCIVHWNLNHFVVLIRSTSKKLVIADPSAGIMKLSSEQFLRRWIPGSTTGKLEGIALFMEPTSAFYNNADAKTNTRKELRFRDVLHYITPYRKLIVQLLIGLALGSLLQLIIPFLSKSVIDIGIKGANLNFVYIILVAQLALFAGRLFLDFIRNWILLHISTRINISILSDFLMKLLRLPISYFDSKNTGDILQRMNDHQRIESFLTGSSLNILFSVFNLLIFSVILAMFNMTIFIVFFSLTTVYSIWIALFLKKRRELEYKRFDIASLEQNAAIQIIQGMQEIKINGIEQSIRAKWEKLQENLFKLVFRGQELTQKQTIGAFFINEGKNIIITFLSAKAVIDGQMTLGSMLAVQYIIGQLNSPVEQMINFVQSLQYVKISLARINEIHTLEDEEPAGKDFINEFALRSVGQPGSPGKSIQVHEDTNVNNRGHGDSSIRFQNVSFTYPGAGNEPVLRNINFEIPIGETTAIVGTSGSGKTTLLKLLLKFYPPGEGDILLGRNSLLDIGFRSWRKACGVVMQDSFIFSDTVARNIALGDADIEIDRLHDAVRQANLTELIDTLPQKYETKLGVDGTGLSMGQRQRILIARAIYRDPQFMFLDEATNSLDSNNESYILRNLERFLQKKTVVVVAHRLSTVRNAARIVVLKNGEIAEIGSHQELIKMKGEYYTLVKNQLELDE